MSKDEQQTLLEELSTSILNDMCYCIRAGKVPADWNGVELRQWFAEKAKAATLASFPQEQPERWKSYSNTVLTCNL